MIHKITASLLLTLIALVSTTMHQGVRFCKSQDEFFVIDCPCSGIGDNEAGEYKKCCDSSSCATTKSQSSQVTLNESKLPDCVIELSWGVESDWLEAENIRLSEKKHQAAVIHWSEPIQLKPERFTLNHSARGPPSFPHITLPVPIFIRHSVFLI